MTERAKRLGASIVAITDTPCRPSASGSTWFCRPSSSGLCTQNSLVAAMAVTKALLNGVIAGSPDAMGRYGEIVSMMNEWESTSSRATMPS